MILSAYRQGFFPMARGRRGPIEWFMAEPRTIIPLDERFTVRRSLRKLLRKNPYQIRIDRDFEGVIRACSRHFEVPEEEIWLSEEMIRLYQQLHELGFAHSIEAWSGESLVGGLYGVGLNGAFFGESMFTRAPSASQVALVALVERLRERHYRLLDAQMRTPHIAQFGAIDLAHEGYLLQLGEALRVDCRFS
jgi:leucyl/phenylalanyl-tRNA--protein transferase